MVQESAGAPLEAELVRRHREELIPPRSPEKLAKVIGISGKRWRDIERGLDANGRPTQARAQTLADIAKVLGIGPEQLEEAGRADAARILSAVTRDRAETEPALAGIVQPEATPVALLQQILQVLDEIRTDDRLSAGQRRQLEEAFVTGLQRDVQNLQDQFRTMIRVVGGGA
ncbi:helix-turn-helix transcriptional regulator [Spirillospora sp. NPDC047279]|uniref:helix-turn-helix domain-containing protein n=1 Tax=Spirillospora sp. NPDC047279 TaxID=3155478 RepID=UPI0033EF5E2B